MNGLKTESDNMFIKGLLVGILIGEIFGFITAAFCAGASRGDDNENY